MRKLFLLVLFSFTLLSVQAAIVDTVWIESKAMKKSFRCVVIQPTTSSPQKAPYPVTYLLHGYGGWYANWIIRVPALKDYADRYQMLIVCPEGNNDWYLNSPEIDSLQWETYIAVEIPAYIDNHYPTKANRDSRAITGLSMGGHGGLYLGLKHSNTFGACGSMSGGVDLNFRKNSWSLLRLLGDTIQYAQRWIDYSVTGLADKIKPGASEIIIDCGTEDFFFGINEKLHQQLTTRGIPHEYTTRPGKHDWNYWRNAVAFQLLFFHHFFSKTETR
jgi:S-formylglutathione hydrolase FrmB